MPKKSGETEAGVSSWQNWTRGCGFTPAPGRGSITCGPDWRAAWQRELVSYCWRSCPRGATWRDTGTSAKQAGDVLLDLTGSERRFIYLFIYIHISPPSWASLPHPIPPLQIIRKHGAELPVLHSSFPLALCFTYGNAYISVLDSGCILKVASRLADR